MTVVHHLSQERDTPGNEPFPKFTQGAINISRSSTGLINTSTSSSNTGAHLALPRTHTVRHILASSQNRVKSLFAKTLSTYRRDPLNEGSLFAILAFPKLVLLTMPVRGQTPQHRQHQSWAKDTTSSWDKAQRETPGSLRQGVMETRVAKQWTQTKLTCVTPQELGI